MVTSRAGKPYELKGQIGSDLRAARSSLKALPLVIGVGRPIDSGCETRTRQMIRPAFYEVWTEPGL